eukprot:6909349-Alexandrium_andersonii.AAC.1
MRAGSRVSLATASPGAAGRAAGGMDTLGDQRRLRKAVRVFSRAKRLRVFAARRRDELNREIERWHAGR